MEGITRYAGKKHFTSTQHRSIFKEIIGPDSYILETNEKLEPELQSNNLLRIRSGMLCHHGFISEIKKNTYDEVTINNGTQGMKRIDLVVLRHTRNAETEVEDCEWVVIRGTPAASGAAVPECTNGDINNGDLVDDCPVFKVELEGIQVVSVTKLLKVLGGTLAGQAKAITELNGNSIIETGSNSNGHYRKYADGTLEMWGDVALASVPINGPNGVFFHADTLQLPYTSLTSVDVQLTLRTNTGSWATGSMAGDSRSTIGYYLRQTVATTISGRLDFHCFGTWK